MEPPKIPNLPASGILPAGASSGLVGRVPPGLAAFPPETLLTATVLRVDAQGQAVIRTPAGDLTIKSDVPLQQGSTLVLRVINNSLAQQLNTPAGQPPSFQAQVLSINGQAIAPPGDPALTTNPVLVNAVAPNAQQATQQATGRPDATPQGAAQAATQNAAPREATIVNVSGGAIIKAVVTTPKPEAQQYIPPPVLSPAAVAQRVAQQSYQQAVTTTGGVPAAAPPTDVRSGDVLIVHVLGVKYPATAPNVAPQAGVPPQVAQQAAPNQTILPNNQPGAPVPQVAVPTPGANATVPPLTTQAPFTATVIGTERSGATVLSSPLGTIKLHIDPPLTKGAEIRLEVLAQEPRAASLPTNAPAAESEELKSWLANGKTTLTEIASFIQQRFGGDGQDALQQTLPNTNNGQQFASRLLWFMGGVYSGNAGVFLGPDMQRMLEQSGKSDMVQRLQKDFGRIRQAAQDGLGNGWTGMMFPVMDGEKLEHGMMFSRKYREEASDGSTEEGTRFVVELNMSKMGEMQLDGLYRKEGQGKQFDLFVRTHKALEGDVRRDIHDIFAASTSATGLKGAIQFQVLREFPVSPMEEESSTPPPDLGNIVA